MGVGKTATVWRALDYIGAKRAIIVCPAMLRENWIGEGRKFSIFDDRRVCKGRNIHDYYAWKRGKYNILVTSYELMTKWSKDYYETGEILDAFVMDEAHYLKNSNTARTKALF